MPLKDKKVKVKEDLSKLSGAGFISSDSHYQAMMKLIAQDIRNQRRYRAARRQVFSSCQLLFYFSLLTMLSNM